MKKRVEATDVVLPRNAKNNMDMRCKKQGSLTEHKNNKKNLYKQKETFPDHMMRKKGLEKLILTGRKRNKWKQVITS